MNLNKILILTFFSLLVLLTACDSGSEGNTPAPNTKPASLEIEFQLFNGDSLINTDSPVLNVSNGAIVRIQDLAFYLSNFELGNTSQSLKKRNSYHLIRLSRNTAKQSVIWDSIPAGEYKSLNFFFGVDAAANSSTDQVGDLDIQNNMAWNWATGYKFLLLEGSYQQGNSPRRAIVWHLGFNEIYKAISSTENPLVSNISIKAGERKKIVIKVDMAKLFTNINLTDDSTIMTKGSLNSQLAENFARSFSLFN